MNSRQKGKRGELELAHVLEEYGVKARRGQQYSGLQGDADVVGLDGVHIECKRVEQLNVENAMQQAERDAQEGEIPAVFHRKNREEWKVTIRLEDFMNLYLGPRTKPIPPCKDCESRYEGCHSECVRYRRYQEGIAKYKERIKKAKQDDGLMQSYEIRKYRRLEGGKK